MIILLGLALMGAGWEIWYGNDGYYSSTQGKPVKDKILAAVSMVGGFALFIWSVNYYVLES